MSTIDTNAFTMQSGSSATTVIGSEVRPRGLEGGLRRGDALGRYLVLDVLGRGGMGMVYSAYDPKLDRRVAIKVVLGRAGSVEDSRLLREAQALAKLSHPNVVAVHDVGTWNDSVFVAMELVEGETVATWIERRTHTERPTWQEVLEVMVPAGRGLEAAHAVGIVHRDFKPQNVMIAPSGRVTVLDFGLARAVDPDATPMEDAAVSSQPASSLTETGTVMGTPAYMSPEQLEGRGADEASDQFSFCVALYQALYGMRPFAGASIGDLLLSIATGQIQSAGDDDPVPSWLRRVVVRGLAPVPEERYASMSELLAALTPAPRRWRLLVAVGALALAAGGLGWALAPDDAPEDACDAADQAMAEAWSPATREAMARAFRADAKRHSEQALEQVGEVLDDYAERWVSERRSACEAAIAVGTDAAGDAARQATCLDQRLGRFQALVRLLGDADRVMVGRAVEAVRSLPPPQECRGPEGWRATTPVPADPIARAEVEALLLRTDEVYALGMMGRLEPAFTLAKELLEEGKALGFPPVEVHLMRLVGALRTQLGDYAGGRAMLEDTLLLARTHQLELLEFQALDGLAFIASEIDGELELAEWHVRTMEMLAHRLGDGPLNRARVLHSRARLSRAQGDIDVSVQLYRQAIAQYERSDATLSDRIVAYDNLANAFQMEDRYDDAAEVVAKAREIAEGTLGPGHPQHGHLLVHSGRIESARGNDEAAAEQLARGVELMEDAYGPGHPNVAAGLNGLAMTLSKLGRHDDAEAAYRRGIEICEETSGPTSSRTRTLQRNLASSMRRRGRPEDALVLDLAAHDSDERNAERTSGLHLAEIADDMQALGRCEEAGPQYELALARLAEDDEDEPSVLARTQRGLGMCALLQGNLGRARALLEQALQAVEVDEDDRWTPTQRALCRFALAMAIADTEPERSASLADEAERYFADHEVEERRRLEQLRRWRDGGEIEPLY